MRTLFEIDKKNYDPNGTKGVRPSVRGIIIKDNKIAMIHSLKYNYYKFPGGGMEEGENNIDTLCREVAEESGLEVIPSSVKEYGYVHRVQKGTHEDIFIQDNYYYLCEASDTIHEQKLDDYEDEELFTLEWTTPYIALETNRFADHGEKADNPLFDSMCERECRVIEMLVNEGYFTPEKGD